MTLYQAAGKLAAAQLTADDVERAKKQRDKANFGGGVHQSWTRIVEALEAVLVIEQGLTEQGGQG
jgi:hypothetical protein